MLTPADLDELTNILRLNEQPVWTASPEFRRCFQSIANIVRDDGGGKHLSRLTVRLNELFVLLLEVLRSGKVHLDHSLTTTRRTVELFLEDLRAHPENLAREWQVEEMARSCGLGVSQFSQHVRFLVNMSPVQFLTRCRIDRAISILNSNSKASITDVALECGFSSGQYFATIFKRWTGHSPRAERSKRLALSPLGFAPQPQAKGAQS
jgi:AraC family L-rhamnose operon regulatory protein RhaS